MTWLAIGSCSVAAGYAFYILYSHYKSKTATSLKSPQLIFEHIGSEEVVINTEKNLNGIQDRELNGNPTNLENTGSQSKPPIAPEKKEHTNENVSENGETKQKSTQKSCHSMPPPSIPQMSKINTIRSQSPPRLKPPTFSSAPVPPRSTNGSLRPPPSTASTLRVPATKVLQNSSMAPSPSSLMSQQQQTPKSRQVILKPGHSPLDWAALTSNPTKTTVLRGKDALPAEKLLRVTPSRLKYQNGRKGKDAWTVYQGKVYNITAYLSFHPGGEAEIMKGAGRDSAKLFLEVHPWVNWDGMLGDCLVGILVSEMEEKEDYTKLDEMD